jgi:glutamate--cysteine ligase
LNKIFEKRIESLAASENAGGLAGGLKGIEKESLRVRSDGKLATTVHPQALGSALTNRFITTDFSEALLEFVTPAFAHTWEALRSLCEIHQFSYERIGDELLWVNSMPCLMAEDAAIPLAEYGDSNVGRMKNIYRNGLGFRYGRKMQTIAGIHYNYSLPQGFWPQYQDMEKSSLGADDFRSEAYLGLVRNFRRMGWLILYLFGSSPALCKSFMGDKDTGMPMLDKHTIYEPFGTSLRMSDLGYTNSTQAGLSISLNNLNDYVNDLSCAICTPEPAYEKIGLRVDGQYRQLNANQLQIENEYYSPVRPKRVANSGERPTAALRRGGIEYVEIRSLDLNVFDPVGINQHAMRFTEAFLIYCLLADSPLFDERMSHESSSNHSKTATHGRDPQLALLRNGSEQPLREWAREIMQDVAAVATLIDKSEGGDSYTQSVNSQSNLIDDAEATPSARVLEELRQSQAGFFQFAMNSARGHKEYFSSLASLESERLEIYENEASQSIERQSEIEAGDEVDFEEYLANYYSQDGCP